MILFIVLFSKIASSDTPKRILLIIMDGARYDYCTPETMPNLFSFMKDAMEFKNAYSSSSCRRPHHMPLFLPVCTLNNMERLDYLMNQP